MDFLIPLGSGSKHNNIECLFTLRAITLHHPESDVTIIGEKPIWYKGNHIPFTDDPTGTKENNIRRKVLHYCELNPGTQFIFANDDHFLQQPFDGRNYHEKTLSYFNSLLFGGIYKRCILNTIEICGPDYPYYDVHYPMVIDADKFIQYMSDDWTRNRSYVMKTLYAYRCQLDGIECKDAGLKSPHDYHEIKSLVAGRPVFTIVSDDAMTKGLLKYLNEQYPTRSKWE